MAIERPHSLSRRDHLRLALAAAASLCAPEALAAGPPVVTLLGDSIVAGYGLSRAQAMPARLQAALTAHGVAARIRAAGVSGDTMADGLARLDFSVQPDTRLCVVALGGNDLLQGLDPRVTRANLDRIVQRLQRRGVTVLIAGIAAPPVIGAGYARAFDAAFASVAHARHAGLYRDLLAGVGGHAPLIQRDGVHPNSAGTEVIAQRLAPVIARELASRR